MRKSTCIAAGLLVVLGLVLVCWTLWTHAPRDASVADGGRDRRLLESGAPPGPSGTPVLLGGRTGNETDLDGSMLAGAGGVAARRKSDDVVAIVGRVVDERRRPASGVEVGILIGGEQAVHGQTDERGRFAVHVPRPRRAGFERLTVIARREPADVALHITYFSREGPETTDVGALVLAHSVPLEVEVLVDGAPKADADVWISSWEQAAPGHLCGHARTNGSGLAKLYVASAGAHRVVAFAPSRSRAVVMTSLPRLDWGRCGSNCLQHARLT